MTSVRNDPNLTQSLSLSYDVKEYNQIIIVQVMYTKKHDYFIDTFEIIAQTKLSTKWANQEGIISLR